MSQLVSVNIGILYFSLVERTLMELSNIHNVRELR